MIRIVWVVLFVSICLVMSNGAVRATCSDEKVRIVFWAPSWFEDVAAGQFSSTKKMVLLR